MMSRSRLLRFGAALVAGFSAIVIGAGAAAAHTNFTGSDPVDSAVLVDAPNRVRLDFSEDLDPQFVKIALSNADGTAVPLDADALVVSAATISVTIPELTKDTYELTFDVRDPVDLHQTTGSIVFGVGVAPTLTSATARTADATALQLASRILERAALVLLIGALLVRFFVAPPGNTSAAWRRRSHQILMIAGVSLVAAEATVFLLEAFDIGSVDLEVLRRLAMNSAFGRRSFIAVQLTVGVMLLLRYLSVPAPVSWRVLRRDPILIGFLALVVALVATVSYTSHDSIGGSQLVGLTIRALHLAAIGVWVGGLVVVLGCGTLGDRAIVFRRFSPIAAGALAVTVVSGLLMASREVYSATAAFHTGFGQLLTVKVALLSVVLVAALSHRRRLGSGSIPRPRLLAFEAAVLAVVVVAGSVLSVKPPAVGARFSPDPPEQVTSRSLQIDDVLVQVSIRPNRPGRNTLSMSVLNTRRPAPADIEQSTIRLASPTQAPTERLMPGAFGPTVDLGAVDLVAPGALDVEVLVSRPKVPVATFVIPWSVNPLPLQRPDTVISDAPLAGPLQAMAIVVAVIALAGGLASLLRRRPRKGHHLDSSRDYRRDELAQPAVQEHAMVSVD